MTVVIHAADVVVPIVPKRSVIPDGAVAVDGDTIAAVGTRAELQQRYPQAAVTEHADRVLLPGLVNAHHHSGILRGTAEHLPVWEWLKIHIDPMHRVLQPHEAEAAARLCYAEGLLAGTTTVADMWRYMDRAAQVAVELGNRLVTINYVGAHPDFDFFDTLDDNQRMLERWSGHERITPWVGLEHPFYADQAGQQHAIELARSYGTGLYTHCSEGEVEVAAFQQRYGKRPVLALDDLGFFEAPLVHLAHAIWLDDEEIALLAARGGAMSHNPVSNMKLASGIARVQDLLDAGVKVGLGTDGEKENNNLDMFEEMKVASLLGKLRAMDAAALDSWQVLEMATIGSASALGLDARIGSLEPGKQADFITVRADTPRMTPFLPGGDYPNIHHNLVHAVRGSDVDTTVVAGQVLVSDGELRTAKLGEVIAAARAAVPGLFQRRSDYLATGPTHVTAF